jgi:hypothetical protein
MTLKELEERIDQLDTQVTRASRGDDTKILIGTLAQGVFEVARQLARLNELAEKANG